MAITESEIMRLREKVEVLTGERGNVSRRALRLGEIGNIQELIAELNGTASVSEVQISSNTADITALDGRVTTAETDITALDSRVTTAESDITALDGRVTTAEGVLTAIDAAATAITVPALTATNLVGAPTAADYNKVVADLTALRTAIIDLRAALI